MCDLILFQNKLASLFQVCDLVPCMLLITFYCAFWITNFISTLSDVWHHLLKSLQKWDRTPN